MIIIMGALLGELPGNGEDGLRQTGDCNPGTAFQQNDDVTDMVSSYTKAIIINSPNNPSGAVYKADFIGGLVEFCEKKGIYLIMDDIYHKLVFPPAQWTPCYKYSQVDPNQSKLIVINGVSKLYAMTGYRIGWTIASKQIVDTMVNVQAQTTSCTPLLSQVAAVGALTGLQSGVESCV
jgi:aspartate aminotransferase